MTQRFLRMFAGVVAIAVVCGCSDPGSPMKSDEIVSLGLGAEHLCAIMASGDVICGGRSVEGEAGTGAKEYDVALQPVHGDLKAVELSTGFYHNCALKSDGSVWCWGYNSDGQIGVGTGTGGGPGGSVYAPEFQAETTERFARIAAGPMSSCALTEEGLAYCWGSRFAAAGDETGERCPGVSLLGSYPCNTRPTPVSGVLFQSISPGWAHACGIGVDAKAYCWGGFADPRGLGTGGLGTVTPTIVQTSVPFVSISAGWNGSSPHTCALDAEGGAWCWGSGQSGRLGTGDELARTFPTRVATSVRFRPIARMAATDFTCGLAVDSTAYCWGSDVLYPTAVSTTLKFIDLFVGVSRACGLTTDRKAYCWTGAHGPPQELIIPH